MNTRSSSSSSDEEFHEVDWGAFDPVFDYEDPLVRPPTITAVYSDNVEYLKRLIKSHSVNNIDNTGCTALHVAVRERKRESFNYLITLEDIDLGRHNFKGHTPLTLACKHNDSYFAKGLIQRGADVNQCTIHGISPLCIAIKSCLEIVKVLLENGADVNYMSDHGYTALQIACMNNNYDGVHMLLYYGAVVTMVSHFFLMEFMTWAPLDCLETLLFHYLDEKHKVDLYFINMIIRRKVDLFPVILERITEVDCERGRLKCKIYDVEQLVALLKKFPSFREYFFQNFNVSEANLEPRASLEVFTKFIFKLAEESLLLSDYLESNATNIQIIVRAYRKFNMCKGELTELILILVSHGLPVDIEDFLQVYSHFGNGFVVKFLLHITLDNLYTKPFFLTMLDQELMGVLIHKPNFNFSGDIAKSAPNFIDRFPFRFRFLNPISAFRFFANTDFHKFISNFYSQNGDVKALLRQPRFPSLVELSRNVLQRFIYSKYEISDEKPGKYYDIVKRLPVPNSCKQILTFDVELYSV